MDLLQCDRGQREEEQRRRMLAEDLRELELEEHELEHSILLFDQHSASMRQQLQLQGEVRREARSRQEEGGEERAACNEVSCRSCGGCFTDTGGRYSAGWRQEQTGGSGAGRTRRVRRGS
eukprot:23639-Hanusia_phi.AAC.1